MRVMDDGMIFEHRQVIEFYVYTLEINLIALHTKFNSKVANDDVE
jgi:hypothetical protein